MRAHESDVFSHTVLGQSLDPSVCSLSLIFHVSRQNVSSAAYYRCLHYMCHITAWNIWFSLGKIMALFKSMEVLSLMSTRQKFCPMSLIQVWPSNISSHILFRALCNIQVQRTDFLLPKSIPWQVLKLCYNVIYHLLWGRKKCIWVTYLHLMIFLLFSRIRSFLFPLSIL